MASLSSLSRLDLFMTPFIMHSACGIISHIHVVCRADTSSTHHKILLYSFGGFDFPLDAVSKWNIPLNWTVVYVDRKGTISAGLSSIPSGVALPTESEMDANGMLPIT